MNLFFKEKVEFWYLHFDFRFRRFKNKINFSYLGRDYMLSASSSNSANSGMTHTV